MNYEKSCGAAVFRETGTEREYLLVLNKKNDAEGHWGFPKGHTEAGENEYATAAREVYEETGVQIVFYGKARAVSHYSPKPGVEKDAVYFLASLRENQEITLQKSEVAEYRWCNAEHAKSLLTFDGDILAKLEKQI